MRGIWIYLALGDWHSCKGSGSATWYAGTPEPDDFDQDSGAVLIVELRGPGVAPTVERGPGSGVIGGTNLRAQLQSPGAVEQLRACLASARSLLPPRWWSGSARCVSLSERAAIAEELANFEATVQVLRARTIDLIPSPDRRGPYDLGAKDSFQS